MLITLSFACIFLAGVGGICTAIILKRLDNIVKLYAQITSAIVTSIACMIIFPSEFQFDAVFVTSLILTVVAVVMYERSDIFGLPVSLPSPLSRFCRSTENKGMDVAAEVIEVK